MPHTRFHASNIPRCLLLLLLTASHSTAAEITSDVTIDSASAFNGVAITVRDSSSGSTTVSIVEGGSVAGFVAQDTSRITFAGGNSTFLGLIKDNAVVRVLDGSIGCLEPSCSFIDYEAAVAIEDNGQLVLEGGSVGSISLRDNGMLEVIGQELELIELNDTDLKVEGSASDGSPISISLFGNVPDIKNQVILRQIPEPKSLTLIMVLLMTAGCHAHTRSG